MHMANDIGSIEASRFPLGLEPVDTHLFLNGDESDETHERLMRIAATTCYLHATLASALEPVVSIEMNGAALAA
jgi:uncharacterized OsmC-like protein